MTGREADCGKVSRAIPNGWGKESGIRIKTRETARVSSTVVSAMPLSSVGA